jgi:deoxycytidylate deaminase
MEALMSCARRGITSIGATVYCTTFPCHNCAKHIVAAGIARVVFVEPYSKSKALDFHDDSIVYTDSEAGSAPVTNSNEKLEILGRRRSGVSKTPNFGYNFSREATCGLKLQRAKRL